MPRSPDREIKMTFQNSTVNSAERFSRRLAIALRKEIPAVHEISPDGWWLDRDRKLLNTVWPDSPDLGKQHPSEYMEWIDESDLFRPFATDALFSCYTTGLTHLPVRVAKEAIRSGRIPIRMQAAGLEVDVKAEPGQWQPGEFEALCERALSGPIASQFAIWQTPRGIRLFTWLREPVWLSSADDLILYEGFLRGLTRAIEAESGLEFDLPVCSDATRLQRIARGTRDGEPVDLAIWRPTPGEIDLGAFVPLFDANGSETDEIPAPLPPITQRPRQNHDPNTLAGRVRAYLDNCDPAVSGRGGRAQACRTMLRVVAGFDLTLQQAVDAGDYFNATCVPPWEPGEFRRLYSRTAWEMAQRGSRGDLLVDRPWEGSEDRVDIEDYRANYERDAIIAAAEMRARWEESKRRQSEPAIEPDPVIEPTTDQAVELNPTLELYGQVRSDIADPKLAKFTIWELGKENRALPGLVADAPLFTPSLVEASFNTGVRCDRYQRDSLHDSDRKELHRLAKRTHACAVAHRTNAKTHHLESIGGQRRWCCSAPKFCWRCCRGRSRAVADAFAWTMLCERNQEAVNVAIVEMRGDSLREARDKILAWSDAISYAVSGRDGHEPVELLRIISTWLSETTATTGDKASMSCVFFWPTDQDDYRLRRVLDRMGAAGPVEQSIELAWRTIRGALEVPDWQFEEGCSCDAMTEYYDGQFGREDVFKSKALRSIWTAPPDPNAPPDAPPGDPEKGDFKLVAHVDEIVQTAKDDLGGAEAVIDLIVAGSYAYERSGALYKPVVRRKHDEAWESWLKLPVGEREGRSHPPEVDAPEVVRSMMEDVRVICRKVWKGAEVNDQRDIAKAIWDRRLQESREWRPDPNDTHADGVRFMSEIRRAPGGLRAFRRMELEGANAIRARYGLPQFDLARI